MISECFKLRLETQVVLVTAQRAQGKQGPLVLLLAPSIWFVFVTIDSVVGDR